MARQAIGRLSTFGVLPRLQAIDVFGANAEFDEVYCLCHA
jgi:hypothetical protein